MPMASALPEGQPPGRQVGTVVVLAGRLDHPLAGSLTDAGFNLRLLLRAITRLGLRGNDSACRHRSSAWFLLPR